MIPSQDEQLAGQNEPGVNPSDASRLAGTDVGGAASLDKVRDILFGGQMREVERRFARLEERLLKETNDLKEDVKRRLDALEAYARAETESLAGEIKAERTDRVESHGSLSRELKDTASTLERRTLSLDEQHEKSQREVRQQMLEQHQRISDDIRQRIDEVLATLARETDLLRADKADRTAIASLLTEMAMRLTNEFRIPGVEDVGNG